MKALDTNVLVRFLVRDDPGQAEAVYQLFKGAEARKLTFWVPLVVVLETLWVLDAVYHIGRDEILDALENLLLMPVLMFESQAAVRDFVGSSRKSSLGLPDILIAHAARHSGCDGVLTFDKKAAQTPLFELVRV